MFMCFDRPQQSLPPQGLSPFTNVIVRAFCTCAFVLVLVSASQCQSTARYNPGLLDHDVPIPAAVVKSGQIDPMALSEIASHLKAVGAGPWIGMQGTGTITWGNDATNYDATLTALGASRFRLDAQTVNGPMSIRIERNAGNIQRPDGTRAQLPPMTAASGLVQFEVPRLANLSVFSLVDHGLVAVQGVQLHRITVSSKASNVIDMYFDPTSHLLVKTATAIALGGMRNTSLLRVVTYADYRAVGSSLIPFRYIETLGGQPQWTLQLSSAQTDPTLNEQYFQF